MGNHGSRNILSMVNVVRFVEYGPISTKYNHAYSHP